jgi:geranylgeranyl reductase family protein
VTRSACDVLVVGAGPAGASAALAAARAGARVTVVDRRGTIGRPVQCAEYIPALLLREVPACAPAVVQRVNAMRTFVRGEPAGDLAAPGCMVDRDRFDRLLAAEAERAGAQLLTATAALRCDGDAVVLKRRGGEPFVLRPRVVVGADGPRSTVGRWVGLINRRFVPAAQARVRLVQPLDVTEVYLHPDYHAGYAWLFPKQGTANAGVGFAPSPGGRRPGAALAAFLAALERRGRIAGPVLSRQAGWIPVEPLDRTVRGNRLLAGDAAGQTHPVTGAGIFSAVTCGAMAGRWAARAALEGDPGLLEGYEEEWRDLLGSTLARAAAKRRLMESGWGRFDAIIRSCWVAFEEYHA